MKFFNNSGCHWAAWAQAALALMAYRARLQGLKERRDRSRPSSWLVSGLRSWRWRWWRTRPGSSTICTGPAWHTRRRQVALVTSTWHTSLTQRTSSTALWPTVRLTGLSWALRLTSCTLSKKTGPLRVISWHNFTNSQRLLIIIFGRERPYSILNWCDKKFFLNWLRTSGVFP